MHCKSRRNSILLQKFLMLWGIFYCEDPLTESAVDLTVHYSIYLIATVDLVSDPPTQLSTSRGAEPGLESAASLMRDLLHGTVFHTISIKSVTLVFSSAASKLNYFVQHMSLVPVSTTGRSVNSAIQMTLLLLQSQ